MKQRGFTLLEVLVAIAILGLCLTAILSAQAGAVRGVSHARYINVAVGLARCKMSEIEEHLGREGFNELDETENGPCCADNDSSGMDCQWRIEKPVFPDPDFGELDLDSGLDSSTLGKLNETAKGGQIGSEGDSAGIGDLAQTLAGDPAELAAGGVGGLASTVMGMVYPDLKAMFEASSRRVTVTVNWQEGSRAHDLEIVQWITKPQPGVLETDSEDEEGSSSSSSSSSGSTTSNPAGGTR